MKEKIKKLFKDKTKMMIAIGSLAFLLLGLVAFVVGAYLTGWDLWSWLLTEKAILLYAGVLVYILVAVWFGFHKKIGGKYNE